MVVVTTGTTVVTLLAIAVTTRAALVVVAGSAGCALRLYVAFGLGLKGTHLQAVFAGLLVDLDEFDLNFVTFLET